MVMMMQNLIKSWKDNALFFYIYFFNLLRKPVNTTRTDSIHIFYKWAGKFIMKCIPVVGTVNTLWFQKGSKPYEPLENIKQRLEGRECVT